MAAKDAPNIQRNGLPRKTGLSRSHVNLTDVGLSSYEISLNDVRRDPVDLPHYVVSDAHQIRYADQYSFSSVHRLNGHPRQPEINGFHPVANLAKRPAAEKFPPPRLYENHKIPYAEKALSNSALNNPTSLLNHPSAVYLNRRAAPPPLFDKTKIIPVDFKKTSSDNNNQQHVYRAEYCGGNSRGDCSAGGLHTPSSYRSSISSEDSASSPASFASNLRSGPGRPAPTYQLPPDYNTASGYGRVSANGQIHNEYSTATQQQQYLPNTIYSPRHTTQPPDLPINLNLSARYISPIESINKPSILKPPAYSNSQSPTPTSTITASSPAISLTSVKSVEVAKPHLQHAVIPEPMKPRKQPTPTGCQQRMYQQSPNYQQTPSPEYFSSGPVGVLATGRCEPVASSKFRQQNLDQNITSPVHVISSPFEDDSRVTVISHQADSASNNSDTAAVEAEFKRTWNNPYSNISPDAYKFYIEQHMDTIQKLHSSRFRRRLELENELDSNNINDSLRQQLRAVLAQKESNHMRMSRVKLNRTNFSVIEKIGVGAFGEVALVKKIDTQQIFAMKTLKKSHILQRNQIGHVMAERDILAKAENEWVVKLFYSFQDKENLYIVMEYIPGGDLMTLLMKKGQFDEPFAKFYIAELVVAVGSVHSLGFIHRDIKPDNILIDLHGHLKLTDFGLCTGFDWTHRSQNYPFFGATDKRSPRDCDDNNIHVRTDSLAWQNRDVVKTVEKGANRLPRKGPVFRRGKHDDPIKRQFAHSQVGTPNYMAPEVLLSNDNAGYTQVCDWWSVGVILYEMICGRPPFYADTPEGTQEKVIYWQQHLDVHSYPLSPEARDLIIHLCCDASQRLGNGQSEYTPRPYEPRPLTTLGTEEIKNHPFFHDINLQQNLRKQPSPYVPIVRHQLDTSNFPLDPLLVSPMDLWNDDMVNQNNIESNEQHPFFHFTFRRFFDNTHGDEDKAVIRTPVVNLSQQLKHQNGNGPVENGGGDWDTWLPGNGRVDVRCYSTDSANKVKSPEYRLQEPPPYSAAVTPPGDKNGNMESNGKIGGKSRDRGGVYV